MNSQYRWYVEHGICWGCKKTYAEAGRIYCRACASRVKAKRARNDPGGERNKAYTKAWRDRLRAEGLCIDCGRQAKKGCVRCARCLKRGKEYNQVRRIRERIVKRTL